MSAARHCAVVDFDVNRLLSRRYDKGVRHQRKCGETTHDHSSSSREIVVDSERHRLRSQIVVERKRTGQRRVSSPLRVLVDQLPGRNATAVQRKDHREQEAADLIGHVTVLPIDSVVRVVLISRAVRARALERLEDVVLTAERGLVHTVPSQKCETSSGAPVE
jgi:hypothetical protein